MKIYIHDTNELLTFETIGKLEAEIFSLIDLISVILFNAASDRMYYKKDVIPEKSNLSIISNLTAAESNEMYSIMMAKGYPVSFVQANDLRNAADNNDIENFYSIVTSKNSFKKLKENDLKTDTDFVYGSWQTGEMRESVNLETGSIKYYY